MSKTYRPWNLDQQWLLPPSLHDFVPPGHLAHFVRDTVREELDLTRILETYTEERGYPPYHPVMMTALLLYAYCQGIYSSRRIAKACQERVDFMAVTGMQQPDFRTVSDFRKRHLQALQGLFVQVLRLCQVAGLVKLGHVSLDGTKVHANASKHSAMSYGHMKRAEVELSEEVQRWLDVAQSTDDKEDALHGTTRRGDEMPEWVVNKQRKLHKLREAKAVLEAEAKAEAEQKERERPQRKKKDGTLAKKDGRKPKNPPGTPKDRAQRNFTDPDSRIMNTNHGFEQCYNSQAAVDAGSQVIVACGLTNGAGDQPQLAGMVKEVEDNTGQIPVELSADAGYLSEENLEVLEGKGIRAYVAIGRRKHSKGAAVGDCRFKGPRVDAMRLRLKRGGWRSRYRLRKQTVEPVFGQIKAARGFRQFLLRGLDNVRAEWSLVCMAHNLMKLARATT